MRRVAGILVSLVALGEIAVGVVLVLFPETVVEFLLGARVGPSGTLIARMAALAITALGLAWWEDRNSHDRARLRQVAIGFVGYNVGVGLLFLAYAWGADRLLRIRWRALPSQSWSTEHHPSRRPDEEMQVLSCQPELSGRPKLSFGDAFL